MLAKFWILHLLSTLLGLDENVVQLQLKETSFVRFFYVCAITYYVRETCPLFLSANLEP